MAAMTRYGRVRRRTYEVLEKAGEGDRLSQAVDIVIIAVILANMGAVVLSRSRGSTNVTRGGSPRSNWCRWRCSRWNWRCACGPATCCAWRTWPVAVMRFLVSPVGMIDLLAIVPFYLPLLIPVDLRVVRILRLVRFLRLLKLTRYTRSVTAIAAVVRERRHELMVAVFLTALLLMVASTLMYYMESKVQPDAFPNIIASLWWAVATLTTIGYGDVFPVTDLGRLLSGIIAVLGIGLVALPTAIISSGFVEALARDKAEAADKQAADAVSHALLSALRQAARRRQRTGLIRHTRRVRAASQVWRSAVARWFLLLVAMRLAGGVLVEVEVGLPAHPEPGVAPADAFQRQGHRRRYPDPPVQ